MHKYSLRLMKDFRDKYLTDMKGCSILDIGAKRYGRARSYRGIFFNDYKYFGMDVKGGKNVDIVGYRNLHGVFDVVISGQTMEHIKRPWEWLKYITRYYSKYICIIAPHTWKEHRYPFDTYRYMPDGMRDLFEYAGISVIEIIKDKRDTVGIGGK